jgi:hypothetical protein
MTGPPGPDAVRPPDPRMISFRVPPPVGAARRHLPPQAPARARPAGSRRAERPVASDPETAADAGVRPFVVTNGRTHPVDERLRLETQVVATRQAQEFVLDHECRRIVELCARPLSVAEIGGVLDLPLMVARVLVADLAEIGALVVQEQEAPMSRELLERILERVHAL